MKKIFSLFLALFVWNAICFSQKTGAAAPKIYAIVVGISNYINGNIPDLKFADKDAKAFAEFLKSPNAGAVPDQNIALLTNEKATRSNILKELVQLLSRSSKEDLVIFYFSGHGKNDVFENSGYLLTYDTENDNEAGTAISMDDIKSKIERCQAKMKLSYIDACHAGLFKSSGAKGTANDNGEIIKAYIAGLTDASDGNVAFMASSARQQSLEDEKLGHGIFTHYLIKGLKGEADKEQKEAEGYNDGIITVSEMQTYLSNKIQEATKYKQKPSVEGVYDEEFPLSILRPNQNLSNEIAKRPRKEKKTEKTELTPATYKAPPDEKLSDGMALANQYCHGQYVFINMIKIPLILYKINGATGGSRGRYDTDIKIAPGSQGATPRLYVYMSPWAKSIDMCNDLFDDYTFYFKKVENGVEKYAVINVTVESRKKKYLVLSDDNMNFTDKKPNL